MPLMSQHALRRAQQRAIRLEFIEIALDYGRLRRSWRDWTYSLDDRSLKGTPFERLADRLRGLCVVLTVDGVVRTVKWHHRTRRVRKLKPGEES